MSNSVIADENTEKQNDEIAAISAIYGEEFEEDTSSEGSYIIHFHSLESENFRNTKLKVMLPESYPTMSPPAYEIHAPWMQRSMKQNLHDALQNIYLDNIGEPMLYLWTEKVRDFLLSVAASAPDDSNVESIQGDVKNFDDKNIEIESSLTLSHEIFHGEPLIDRKSVFQAHVTNVTSISQIETVRNSLFQNKKVANATHNIVAYRLQNDKGIVLQDCDDDGETAAGSRLLHLLNILNVENTLVIVSRWYGGIHLGPDRFKHINNVARSALSDHGFLKSEK